MRGRRTLSVLVVLGLVAATVAGTLIAYESERDRAADENAALARQAAATARQDVTAVAAGLRGAAGLVSPEGEMQSQRFRSFARGVLRGTPFPYMSWSRSVAASERRAFERETGVLIKKLAPGGGLEPVATSARRDFLPVTLLHPPDRNRGFVGFDVLSERKRAATVAASIEAGTARLTPPTQLIVQGGGQGAVLYSAVTPPGADEPAGTLIAGISGQAIARAVSRRLDLDGGVAISDGGVPLVGEPDPDSMAAEVMVLGRPWTVSVSGAESTDATAAIGIAAMGISLALAAATLFWVAARRERDLQARRTDAEVKSARESLLVRIGEAIEREIEGDARLGNLARELVPAVGDICVVHEATESGRVRRVGVAAPDESVAELIRALPEPAETSPIRAAITSGAPVLYTRVSENGEARRAGDRDAPASGSDGRTPEEALLADERSNMIVPLTARNRVLGTISLSVLRSSARPSLTRDDLAFAMEVAAHAAVGLDNARLYERQRDIAVILQGALVPRALPQVPGAEVAARHRAGMAGTEVGGDFYDLFEVAGRWMAVVGDVCGKGPQAAALTALARHTVRATARLGPSGAVGRVHDAIKSSGEYTYCTLCCAELVGVDGRIEARVTTAGHPEPRIVKPDGSVTRLPVTGPLVGVLDGPTFSDEGVTLEPGTTLFMCSDGVLEARRQGEVFGDHRLEALLSALSGDEPEALLERVEHEVLRFVDDRPQDDIALFALRVTSG